jgi:hypothetical protein
MGAISADSHKFRIDRVGPLGDPAKNIFIESEYNIRYTAWRATGTGLASGNATRQRIGIKRLILRNAPCSISTKMLSRVWMTR